VKTYVYRSVTLTSYTTGEGESQSASSPYGPVRAGLITSQRTDKEAQLLELLNSLERKAEILVSKSSKVLDTSLAGTTHLVEHSASITDTTSTK
jgi:hypothetical protein